MKSVAVVLVLTAGLICFSTGMAAQQEPYKPVASVLVLMKAIVIPASNAVFDVASEAPKTDDQWDALQNNAVLLAESGNLLMMRAPAKNRADWMKYSRVLVDSAEAALRGAKAKNVDAVLEAGDGIYGSCESCHEKYMNK
jgi:cytochrome c556